jgi:hypothetical protein
VAVTTPMVCQAYDVKVVLWQLLLLVHDVTSACFVFVTVHLTAERHVRSPQASDMAAFMSSKVYVITVCSTVYATVHFLSVPTALTSSAGSPWSSAWSSRTRLRLDRGLSRRDIHSLCGCCAAHKWCGERLLATAFRQDRVRGNSRPDPGRQIALCVPHAEPARAARALTGGS